MAAQETADTGAGGTTPDEYPQQTHMIEASLDDVVSFFVYLLSF
jgi:hypothetical protein